MNPVMRDSAFFGAMGSLLRFLQAFYLHFFRVRIFGFITGFITSILDGNAAADARVAATHDGNAARARKRIHPAPHKWAERGALETKVDAGKRRGSYCAARLMPIAQPQRGATVSP